MCRKAPPIFNYRPNASGENREQPHPLRLTPVEKGFAKAGTTHHTTVFCGTKRQLRSPSTAFHLTAKP